MLKSLLQLFETKESEEQQKHTVELATAALLSEIIRADDNVTAEEAVDLVQFTKIINQTCDPDQKRDILEGLWAIAYADNQLAPIEEHTIRRISDLLHVPHSHFIKAKLRVSPEN